MSNATSTHGLPIRPHRHLRGRKSEEQPADGILPDAAAFRAGHHERHRSRIVRRRLVRGSALVVVLVSGWWGMSALGAHTLAAAGDVSVAGSAPVYVAGWPVVGTGLAKDSAGGDAQPLSEDPGRRPRAGRGASGR